MEIHKQLFSYMLIILLQFRIVSALGFLSRLYPAPKAIHESYSCCKYIGKSETEL